MNVAENMYKFAMFWQLEIRKKCDKHNYTILLQGFRVCIFRKFTSALISFKCKILIKIKCVVITRKTLFVKILNKKNN